MLNFFKSIKITSMPIVIASILLTWLVTPVLSKASIHKIIISDLNYQSFPEISTVIQVLDSNNREVPNISTSDITITEDKNPIVDFSIQKVKSGVNIAIVIDIGQSYGAISTQQFNQMKSLAQQFIEAMDEQDSAEIIVVKNNQSTTITGLTNNRNLLSEQLKNVTNNGATSITNGLDGVNLAITDLLKASGIQVPSEIIFLSPGIQSLLAGQTTSYDDIRNSVRGKNIHFHAITIRNNTDTTQLQNLVEESGLFNQPVSSIMSFMEQDRWQYQINYRNRSGAAGTRQIKVASKGAEQTVFDTTTYTINVMPPEIMSVTINNGNPIVREAKSYSSDLANIDPTEVQISGKINWPDQLPRNISKIELWLDGNSYGEPYIDPGLIEDFTFTWNIRSFITPGTTTSRFEIRITDELGLSSNYFVQVPVEVIIPEAPNPNKVCNPLDQLPYIGKSLLHACQSFGITPGQMINMIIGLTALIMVATIWIKRDTVVSTVRETSTRITTSIQRITQRISSGRLVPLAKLEGLKGLRSDERQSYDLFGTTPIGRDQTYAELIFDNPKISSLHCTIHYEEKDGSWYIQDEDSTNGTFIDGERLEKLGTAPLSNGSTIELAPIERGGIKFRFEIVKSSSDEILDDQIYSENEFGTPINPENIEEDDEDIYSEIPGAQDVRTTAPTPSIHFDNDEDEDEDSFNPSAQSFGG